MKNVGQNVQANMAQLLRGALVRWLETNRADLLSTLAQADYERGAQLLDSLCSRFPWVAGVVTTAMNGSPETAIAAIASYDPALAAELAQHKAQFAELQACWLRGRET